MFYYTISYYTTILYHIRLYHIISYDIISYHITSHHIISYHIISAFCRKKKTKKTYHPPPFPLQPLPAPTDGHHPLHLKVAFQRPQHQHLPAKARRDVFPIGKRGDIPIQLFFRFLKDIPIQGTDTYPTEREKEHHRLKSAF